jgi:hypothetical protein
VLTFTAVVCSASLKFLVAGLWKEREKWRNLQICEWRKQMKREWEIEGKYCVLDFSRGIWISNERFSRFALCQCGLQR